MSVRLKSHVQKGLWSSRLRPTTPLRPDGSLRTSILSWKVEHDGESIRAPAFRKLLEEWSEVLERETPPDKLDLVQGNLRRLKLWAGRFLGEYRVDVITDDVMAQYLEWRCQQVPPPAPSTLRNERSTLSKFFRYARRKRHCNVNALMRHPLADYNRSRSTS